MPFRRLQDWLDHLLTLHPSDIELGLDRVASVAARLSLLAPAATVVTVAGTNGKGTTTSLLEAMACAGGKRVGVYTSPHLLRYNERIRVNGEPASDADIVAAFEAIEAQRLAVPLTFFEFGTLAALQVFSRYDIDLIVLEVGLGGRLDATNIVDPDIAIITSIALDHQEWLGDNREAIGAEKAGILRPDIPAIVADFDPPSSVTDRARALNCTLKILPGDYSSPLKNGLRAENVFAALTAAELLGIHPGDRVGETLSRLAVPGRLQQVQFGNQHVVLDVAHNPAAALHLAEWLREHGHIGATAVFAALSDKDVHAMISACADVFSRWFVVGLPGVDRSLAASELAAQVCAAGGENVTAFADLESAWSELQSEHGREPDSPSLIVVFGSFHTVATFMALST